MSVKQWVFDQTKGEDTQVALFASMIWTLWKCRNKLIFEGLDDIGGSAARATKEARNYKDVATSPNISINSPPIGSNSSIAWSPPPIGWVKLNVDGAAKGNPGMAGGGGVFRDPMGEFLYAFSFVCGICKPVTAELWAVKHGLDLARRMGYTTLILESDSVLVCEMLRNKGKEARQDFQLASQCRRMIDEGDWMVRVNHVRRQANRAADTMANSSFLSSNFSEFAAIPNFLCNSLNIDLGLSNPSDPINN